MENPFADFENEEIFINRKSGTRTGPHKASFDHTTFSIWDPEIEVDNGDTIDRPISPKKAERYTVTQAKFTKEWQGMPACWDITVRSSAAVVDTPPKHVTNNITINNSQGFQIGDHNVQHIVDGFKTLISQIDNSNASPAEKKEAKGRLASFLEHPLTVGILGGAAGGLTGLLKP